MVFTLLEMSLLTFFIFLIEPNIDDQLIDYTSPLRPMKEVFSFIYLCVAAMRSLFKGIIVYTKGQKQVFGFFVGLLARCLICVVLFIITEALPISWALVLSFLWLFFALISGLTFCNLVNLLGMACISLCNSKINENLLPVFCTTMFCLTNTMFSFSLLYLLTKEKMFTFGRTVIIIYKYLIVAKVFNAMIVFFFFDKILKYLAKYYEVGYFNPFITETNQLTIEEE